MIFGVGKFYKNRKDELEKYLGEKDEIVSFLDNLVTDNIEYLGGIRILNPANITSLDYDKIVIMSSYEKEMREQLISLNCTNDNIWSWERFVAEMSHGHFIHYGNALKTNIRKSILIISDDLGYNGGTIAAVYAAKAIQSKDNRVVLVARSGDPKFINEMVNGGIFVTICPSIPYLEKEELEWVNQFDVVIVNTFQMIKCACMISTIKPTLWWIHEPVCYYEETLSKFPRYRDMDCIKRINIQGVSRLPQKNFNAIFPETVKETMPYGIPDDGVCDFNITAKLTFAIVGSVINIKAQDIFAKAVNLLDDSLDASFWIVGSICEDEYCNQVRQLIKDDNRFKIWGNCTREQMKEIYKEIDVVVCPSREDSLPIVMTEGMMYGKVCIVSEAAGTADFIEDGVNGLICKAGDEHSLALKMQWVIDHTDKLGDMGKNARKTYEENFTMEKFAQRLEHVINETIDAYEE